MKWYSYLPFLDEHTYERYLPTAFDESMTLLQKVNKVIEGLNTVIQAMNKTFEEVDKQNDKITAIRDDFETLKEWLENEGLQERTVWVLNEWFDSGRLAQIINNDVFDMKADKATFEQFVVSMNQQLQQKVENSTFEQFELSTNQQLNQTESLLNQTVADIMQRGVNVKALGAKGDGVTDDTLVLQNAMNEHSIIFIPNGTYIVSGVNMLKVRSNQKIVFESRGAILKVANDNGNWQSVFYNDGLVENVVIDGGTIDVNIHNSTADITNGRIDSGRIAIRLMYGKFITIRGMKFITNGFWTVRGKWENGTIQNNHFMFDVRSSALYDYDTSTIWLGGINNLITHNVFESNKKTIDDTDIIGRTAIEFQGHHNAVENNIIIGFRNGVILTNSTSYENPEINVPTVGALNNSIRNNKFIHIQQCVTLWTMNTMGVEPTMRGTQIEHNFILLKKHKNDQACFALGIFRPLGSSYDNPESGVANGKQNGAITDLQILSNYIDSVERYSGGYHAIDLTPTYRMDNIRIEDNTIKNFRGMGIRTGYYQIYNGNVLVDENNHTMTNLLIKGNLFHNVFLPIEFGRNVINALVEGNTFKQVTTYPVGENTVEIIKVRETGKYRATNNIVDYPMAIKPFLPEFKTNYYYYSSLVVDDWNPKVVGELVPVEGRFGNYQQVGIFHLVKRVDGTIARSGSSFGDTLGTIPVAPVVTDIVINSGLTPSYLVVDNALSVKPHDTLKTASVVTALNIFPVIAIEENRLYLGYHPSYSAGKGKSDIVGQTLTYTNNLQPAN